MKKSGPHRSSPPHWPLRLIRRLLNPRYLEELEGDLEERFHDNLKNYNKREAQRRYFWGALRLMRPTLLKNPSGDVRLNQYGMFKHYLKAGYRSLIRDRAHSIINLLGLAVGMGVCLVIFQYVYVELSYDQFHEDHENIYRVVIKESNSNTQETYPDGIGYAFGLAAVDELPEVLAAVRKARVNRTAAVTNPINDRVFYEKVNDLLFVDPAFFQVFNFPLIQGHPPTIFDDEFSIVITARTARKYFGDADPMGQLLKISGPPAPGEYRVTGVLEDLPVNSHLQFQFLMPIAAYIEHGWGGAVKRKDDWTDFKVITYLRTEEGADPEVVRVKLNELIARNSPGEEIKKKVILQPVADIHLGSNDFSYVGYINETGSLQNISIFSAVALFILLIAWTNHINLAIAQSLKRRKEVGIRKTMGAYRKQLVGQFLLESVLINFLAGVLAIAIALLLLPVLSAFIDKELGMTLVHLPRFWIGFVAVVLLGSVISGLYPAFVLSRFQPINALREQPARGKLGLRQGLIVFQFLTSLLLISATYLVYRQTAFMKDQELGMDFEQILVVEGPRVVEERNAGIARFQVFRDELPKHHAVKAVAGSLYVPGEFGIGALRRDLNTPPSQATHSRGFYVTLGFEKAYPLEFLAGGPFTESMVAFDELMIIINEAALAAYGFVTPEEAINKKLFSQHTERAQTVVGVVKNFRWHSLHEDHTSYVIELYEGRLTENISVRINTADLPSTIAHIEKRFEEFFPGNPFVYAFADQSFDRQYRAEQQFGQLFLSFSILAIFIACIGLFALVSYSATFRVKEIGVRKVLGASVRDVMILLSHEYLKLILVAIVLVFPIVWIGALSWLENYAYRIDLGLDVFLVPCCLLLLVAVLTVSQNTLSAARANPVDSLRDE